VSAPSRREIRLPVFVWSDDAHTIVRRAFSQDLRRAAAAGWGGRWDGIGYASRGSHGRDPEAPRASVPFSGQLNGAAVAPGGTVWAVGYTSGEALPEHWNGKNWTFEQDLNAAPSGDFYSVAATSAGNAWAVGYLPGDSGTASLIARWNGSAWKRVTSPSPGLYDQLFGVTATSASNAWTVGEPQDTTGIHTLILHWNGTKWANFTSANLLDYP